MVDFFLRKRIMQSPDGVSDPSSGKHKVEIHRDKVNDTYVFSSFFFFAAIYEVSINYFLEVDFAIYKYGKEISEASREDFSVIVYNSSRTTEYVKLHQKKRSGN